MSAEHPNVLFVCVDAMRSDFALGEYGRPKPFFDYFEREGTVFDTMISAASSTTPCVASYMTGQYPPENGVLSLREFSLDEHVTTLAEVFRNAGYETRAHVCGPLTSDTGLDAGFETYEHRDKDRTVYTDWFDEFKSALTDTSGPWFTYLHLWEAHIHRDLPRDGSATDIEYEESLRGVAEKLSELRSLLDMENTILAVTGDHGESITDGTLRNKAAVIGFNKVPIPFSDMRTRDLRSAIDERYFRPNGIELEAFYNRLRYLSATDFPTAFHREGHGYHVYDFLTRVPFALAGPGVADGRHVGTQVRQVDVFPTLLSAAGLDDGPETDGQNLLVDSIEERPAYTRAVGAFESRDRWLDGVRTSDWKFVKGRERPLRQLFHLKSDPQEVVNVVSEYPEKAAELERLVDEFVAREPSSGQSEISTEAERRMTDRLEDLGYL